jgi:hypothetical protein
MRVVTTHDWHRAIEQNERIARLSDALAGLIDWCEEGCPDGGMFALIEARAALEQKP